MEVNADGSYKYSYQTDDGVLATEEGIGGVKVQGKFAYTSPEGTPIEISYTADENGYQPVGASVPLVPAHVGRALEYIASHPAYVDPVKKA